MQNGKTIESAYKENTTIYGGIARDGKLHVHLPSIMYYITYREQY